MADFRTREEFDAALGAFRLDAIGTERTKEAMNEVAEKHGLWVKREVEVVNTGPVTKDEVQVCGTIVPRGPKPPKIVCETVGLPPYMGKK